MRSIVKPVVRVLSSVADVAEESSGVLVNTARYGRIRTDEWVSGAHGSAVAAAEEHVTRLAERLSDNQKAQESIGEENISRARALLAAASANTDASAYQIAQELFAAE